MGTTLHAIVEVFSPAKEGLILGRWFDICTWDFGKEYAIICSLDEQYRGWPKDMSHEAKDANESGLADTGLYCYPLDAALGLPDKKYDDDDMCPFVWWRVFHAMLKAAKREGLRLRVLFYQL
jgi:hypothetical protein